MRAGERLDHPVELLSASIDGEIKPAEEAVLEAHLEGCAECRGLLEDFRKIDGTIAEEAPPVVPADLRERILAGLASRAVPPSVPFWKQAMPLAAAASLLMVVLLWWGRPDRLAPPGPAEPSRTAESLPQLAYRTAPRAQAYEAIAPPAGPPAAAPAPAAPNARMAAEDRRRLNAAIRPGDAPRGDQKAESLHEFRRATPEAAARGMLLGNDGNATTAAPDAAASAPGAARTAPAAPADEKKAAATEIQKDEMAERLRSLGYVGPETAGTASDGSAAGAEARELAQASKARGRVAAQAPEPVAMMKAAQAPSPGLLAPPYTVRLVADRRMLVQSGQYACTAAVDDADGRRIAAALQESERVLPRSQPAAPEAAAPEADATAADPTAVNASLVIPATPEARDVILRLVRERYRRALEARCGPLPN